MPIDFDALPDQGAPDDDEPRRPVLSLVAPEDERPAPPAIQEGASAIDRLRDLGAKSASFKPRPVDITAAPVDDPEQDLREEYLKSKGHTSDEAIEAERLSGETGTPYRVVLRNLREVKEDAQEQSFFKAAAQNPILVQGLMGMPEGTLDKVKDDMPALTAVAEAVQKLDPREYLPEDWEILKRGGRALVGGALRDTVGSSMAGGGYLASAFAHTLLDTPAQLLESAFRSAFGDEAIDNINNLFSGRTDGEATGVVGISDLLTFAGGHAKDLGNLIDPTSEDDPFGIQVVRGVGQWSGQLIAAMVTGGASGVQILTLLGQGVDQILQQIADDDAPEEYEFAAALAGGLLTAVTSAVELKFLVPGLTKGVQSVLRRVLTQGGLGAIGEGVQEFIENIGQDIIQSLFTDPGKTIDWIDATYGAGVGAVVGLLTGGLVAGAVGTSANRRNRKIQQAEERAKLLADALEASRTMRLHEAAAGDVGQLVQNMAEAAGHTEGVFIDAAAFNQAVQQMPPDQQRALRELMPETFRRLEHPEPAAELSLEGDEGALTGDSIELPLGEVVAAAQSEGFANFLTQNIKASPEAMSLNEATEARAQSEQLLVEEADRVLEQAQNEAELRQSADNVMARISQQLTDLGYDPSEGISDAYATLIRSFYVATSDRLGISPEQLYDRYPLTVAAPDGNPVRAGARPEMPRVFTPQGAEGIRQRLQAILGLDGDTEALVERFSGPEVATTLADIGARLGEGTIDPVQAEAEINALIGPDALEELVKRETVEQQLRPTASPPLVDGRPAATRASFSREGLPNLLNEGGWAMMTAANPAAQQMSEAENAARMEQLKADLDALGLEYMDAIGKYGIVEPSVAVIGIDQATADELGRKYGQDSVLVSDGFIYGDGRTDPTTGEITLYDSPPEDFYTYIPETGAYFAIGIDFGGNEGAFEQRKRLTKEEARKILPKKLTRNTAVNIRKGDGLAGTAGRMSVNEVGAYFDSITERAALDDPEAFRRAVNTMAAELRFQLQQEHSGFDWYDQDIGEAFRITQRYIPELDQEIHRQLFSVVAGIQSAGTKADKNWEIAAVGYKHFTETGVISGLNPLTGRLWAGGPTSRSKQRALDMLNNLVQDRGIEGAVEWIYGEHTVEEINALRKEYGGFGPGSGMRGGKKAVYPGFFMFGPKLGPFIMNLNGMAEVTVDIWATRTLNRYYGHLLDDKGNIRDQPSEPERAVAKELFRATAKRTGLREQDAQAVIWFFEQQLYNHLGTGAASLTFSDGARLFEGLQTAEQGAGEATLSQSASRVRDAGGALGGVGPSRRADGGRVTRAGRAGRAGRGRGVARLSDAERQRYSVSVKGVHFSQESRTELNGRYYGTGLRGVEMERISSAQDDRLDRRVYFYVDEGNGVRPEGGTGQFAHTAQLGNLYDVKADPLQLGDLSENAMESTLLDLGFDGYYMADAFDGHGAAVVIGDAAEAIPVRLAGTPDAPFGKPRLGRYKMGLSSAEIKAMQEVLPQFQEAAPSARVSMGNFEVDHKELAAAQEVAERLGIDMPSFGPNVFSQTVRGNFNPKTLNINLFRDADLSTFLHESGHFFLEVLADIADQPGIDESLLQDMQTVLAWFGVDSLETWRSMTIDEQRPHHERFAETFEHYLFEGQAPSSELRQVFHRFRDFLIEAYGSLRRFMGAYGTELNPEIQGVFDRLLSAANEVDAAQERAGMSPNQRAQAEALDRLSARSLRDLKWARNARSRVLRALQRDVEDKRKAMREEVTEEIRSTPVYAVQRFIKFGELREEDGSVTKVTGAKMSTKALREMYGDGPAAPWRYLSTNMLSNTDDNSMHPDALAEMFGFGNGDRMVRAILNASKEKDAIEGLTEQRLLERYGDIVTQRGMEQAADEAVHNEARGRAVASELKAIKETLNRRTALAAAKQFARNLVGRKRIRSLRPSDHINAERRASNAADRARGKGDMAAALRAKRDQLLHHYTAKYTDDARADVSRKLDYLRKFDRETVRKNLPISHLEQIDQLLEAVDLRRGISNKALDRRASYAEWVESMEAQGLTPITDSTRRAELAKTHYKEMTYSEFLDLVDTVRNIEKLGRLKHKLLTAKDKREFEETRDGIVESIEKNRRKVRRNKLDRPGRLDRAKELTASIFASHRKLSSYIRQLDGFKDGGVFWEALIRPMNERADMEASANAKATADLSAVLTPFFKSKGGMRRKAYIASLEQSLSLEARLVFVLNWGTDTNRQRVRDGNGLTEQNMTEIIGTLSTEQLQAVQNIWDYLESFWPEIKAKEERVTGVAPKKVEPVPFSATSADGTEVHLKGGYYPISYDSLLSGESRAHELAEQTKNALRGAYTRATTRRGHTKQRLDQVGRAVRRDLGALYRHISDVNHDLAWHEWLIDANRLLRDRRLDKAVRETLGPEAVDAIKSAVQDIASGDVSATNGFERSLAWLRTGASVAGLGFNLVSGMVQPLGATQSLVRLGPKYFARGLSRWMGSLSHMESMGKKIHGKSEFMRLRNMTRNREMREIQNRVVGKTALRANIEGSYFTFIVQFQKLVDYPTWMGAYEKALDAGSSEERAIALADQMIRDTQGSGLLSDLSSVERGGPLKKLFTNFYNFFNTTYNMLAESARRNDLRTARGVGNMAVEFLMLVSVPAILGKLLKDALSGAIPVGEDDEKWGDYMADLLVKEQMTYLMGTMLGLRDLSGVVNGFGYSGPAGLRAYNDIARLYSQGARDIREGEFRFSTGMSAIGAASTLFHLPTVQLTRFLRGYKAYVEGETDNPLAVLTGPPRK